SDKEIVGLLKTHKEEIITFLKGELEGLKEMTDGGHNVTAFDRDSVERIPLSYAQQRLWFIDQFEGSLPYHMPMIQKFDQNLNHEALAYALKEIANRHEVLRTVFLDDEGKAYQKILPKDQWELNYEERLALGEQEEAAIVQTLVPLKVNRAFDLSKDHPFRADLIKVSEEAYYLVLVIHHIAFDGWSNTIFIGEFTELYQAKLENRTPELPALPIQYADYALWQRTYLDGEKLAQKLDYWEQKLTGVEVLDLPTDFARPAIQSTRGAHHNVSLNKNVCDQLFELAQKEGVTMFMLFMTTFKVLLHKYAGKEDIAVGTPIANRMQPEIENLIGFFVNTLTIRSDASNNPSFKGLLQQVKKTVLDAYDNQEVPFEKIVDRVTDERNMSHSPLFQVLFSFEASNEKTKKAKANSSQEENSDKKEEDKIYESSMFDISFIISEGPEKYDLKVEYCSDLFLPSSIAQMAKHFEQLLSLVSLNAALTLKELNVLSSAEENLIVKEFNNTDFAFPKTATAISLFEDSVAKFGTRTAVALGAETLTYNELEERSNQLAQYLKKQGVKKETLVALCMNRSLDMMVGILGILKAGGAYVPIAADYPQDRINYILEDSQSKFVLTDTATTSLFAEHKDLTVVSLTEDRAKIAKASKKKLSIALQADNLMYVIYTSGSTGRPKGVMVEHSSNINMALDQIRSFGVTEEDHVLQFASIAFDASVYEIFMALYAGASLVLVDQETIKEGANFVNYLKTQEVSVVTLPPVYLSVLDTASLSFLRVIITAGEAANVAQATQCAVASNYYNAYGPTECAVCVSFYKVSPEDQDLAQIPIGKPLSNTKLYILDEDLKAVPINVEGEICVSGEGLARGYLNRADLTAEKFVDHPYEKGIKLYRTGDRGKFLADGNIVFLGRKDDQVKIRGHRIELGEIETVLHQMPEISQCIVVAKKDKAGNNRLLAYYVGEEIVEDTNISAYLSAQLPAYMVPQIIIGLEAFPLTTNGKIDKKALPNPEAASADEQEYLAPRTPLEADVAEIWKSLLNVDQVSVLDNFFKLGGDSIISIQVVSRIKRLGYQLQPRDLFHHQTVAALAQFLTDDLEKTTILAEQGELTGTADLLPVQQWFFEKDYQSLSHFNMVNLFEVDKEVNLTELDQILKALVAQHDALRFRYTKSADNDTFIQEFGSVEAKVEFVDLTKTKVKDFEKTITNTCQAYQESLDIEKGELIKAVFMATPKKQAKNRFFIVVHHLVIDAVSWHILLSQLQEGMDAVRAGEAIDFGKKSTSFRQWGEKLKEHTVTAPVEAQLPYWEKVANAYEALPVDHPENTDKSLLKDADICEVSLSKALTQTLLKEANSAYGTEINDLLLSALAKTISDWSEKENVVIGLEGHGREFITAEIDITNTLGWFTNLYPISLAVSPAMPSADLIKSVKEQLRTIPGKGLSYNLLRYLHPKEEVRQSLGQAKWDIVFNYLGQEDNTTSTENWLMGATEAPGIFVAEDYPLSHNFEINGAITGGQLNLTWMYSQQYYERSTVTQIAEKFIENLSTLVLHCQKQEGTEKTASDYGIAPEVDYKELNAFLMEEEDGQPRKALIEGLYRLAPMQEGMLFHHLYDQGFGGYTEQLTVDFLSGLDVNAFKKAWEFVIENHTILRTRFFSNSLSIPVQCVYKKVDLSFEHHDFTNFTKEELQEAVEKFAEADLAKGFDFNQVPLMRINVVKLDEKAYKMFWTFHHILIDGWSNPILIEELMTAYELLSEGKTFASIKDSIAIEEDRFEDFIKYIGTKDKTVEQEFWKKYLGEFETPSLLPFIDDNLARNKGGVTEELEHIFTEETTKAIKAYCQANFITANTFIQGIWGFLLSRYTGNEDILFGATVSGRPSDLANAERMIGLFINTMPVRVKLKADATISEVLTVLQNEHTAAREYQYTALNDIQRWIDFSGEFFDSLITFENYPLGDAVGQADSLEVGAVEVKEQTNYLLSIAVSLSHVLDFKFRYNSNLLEASFAAMMKEHFILAIEQTLQKNITKFSEIELVTPKEKVLLLNTFNDTTLPYPKDKSIIAFFEAQVAAAPTKTALIFNGENLSYEALNQRANQLAAYLQEKGVQPADKIGILSYRGFDMIVSLLATLKCGAVYVPLNIDYPKARLEFILNDAGAKFLIYQEENLLAKTGLTDYEFIAVADSATYATEAVTIPNSLSLTSSVYVMYTSGTTGQPKGILVNQDNILKLCFETGPIAIYPEDRVLQWSNFSFDGCTYEIFGALLNGASLCMIAEKEAQDPVSLARVIRAEQLTVNFMTTALFNAFVDQDLEALNELRIVLFGGELVSVPHVKTALATLGAGKIIHVYGPTETTTYASYYPVEHCNDDRVPIGKPLSNTQLYILDPKGDLVGVGMTGEIYIGGAGVSMGYLNRTELMAEKFVEDKFSKKPGAKLYRTGDLGFWLPEGNIEFIGRKDLQVKVRGYRIELGAIETKLQELDAVNNCVVLAKADPSGTKRLIAYVIPNGTYQKEEILNYLKEELPEYMVPSIMVDLPEFPLNANGKVDKRALPEPDLGALISEDYVAPRNKMEEQLVAIWKELLHLDKVGVYDNFFDLGGHSLLATRMMSAIRKELEVEISVKELFTKPNVAALSNFILTAAAKSSLVKITAQERSDKMPLSFAQERLWFIDKLEGSSHYHIPTINRLEATLDKTILTDALQEIVNRHEVLRTVFKEDKGSAYQYILPENEWTLEYDENPAYTNVEVLSAAINTEVSKAFDLAKDHMLRAKLFKASEAEYVLVIVLHHIASDGWSSPILFAELAELYDAKLEDRAPNLAPLTIQYADYALWQRNYLQGEVLDQKIAYWKSKLSGLEALDLPTDFVRPAVQSTKGDRVDFELDKKLFEALQVLAQREGVTVFMLLISVFKVFLYKYSGQTDIAVGIPIANRSQTEIETLIGFFVNTLTLRSDLSDNPSFQSFLNQVKDTTLEAYGYQDVPFEKVVNEVAPERDLSRSPLFQVMLSYENYGEKSSALPTGLSLPSIAEDSNEAPAENDTKEEEGFVYESSKFDLSFNISKREDTLEVSIEYCSDLFLKETIVRMKAHFQALLAAVAAAPAATIDTYHMLSAAEETQILVDFNDTDKTYPVTETLVSLFEAQVEETPTATAIVFEGQELSYVALNERANQLAHHLIDKGVTKESLVCICLDRSLEMMIGILAIIKAGGAYVPIDPTYPAERINYILEDTAARFVMSMASQEEFLGLAKVSELVLLDKDWDTIAKGPKQNVALDLQPNNLAYVIYTSGSTGKPKGVLNQHSGIVNRLLWTQDQYQLVAGEDVVLQKTTFCFDVSVWELFWPIITGVKLVFATPEGHKDNAYLKSVIEAEAVTTMHFVPSMLEVFLPDIQKGDCPSLKRVLCSGEALKGSQVESFINRLPNAELHNLYGPTEAAIDVSYWAAPTTAAEVSVVPIGKPVANTQLYVLNNGGQLAPIGVPGELFIEGIQVARGYHNRPDLTAERFVENTITPERSAVLYRTGDLVRWLPDGNIAYLGRMDHQVKIRGFRIELGEIEAKLQECPLVNSSIVMARPDASGNQQLVAYVIANETYDKQAIQNFLKAQLPEYMVPSMMMELAVFPLNSNGKIDRKALPKFDASELITNEYVAPRNELEETLASIWKSLLNVSQVGIHDNFFELGGDSIISIQVVSRIKLAGYAMQPRDIFQYQTIASLAAVIKDRVNTVKVLTEQGVLEGPAKLLPIQQWYFEKDFSNLSHFNQANLFSLDSNVPVAHLDTALKAIVAQHDALRFRYTKEEQTAAWTQEYGSYAGGLDIVELKETEAEKLSEEIEAACQFYHENLSIERGELIRTVLLKTPNPKENNRLLIVIHHLAIDGVSWRIILDQFQLAMEALEKGQAIDLGPKSSSYRQWEAALEEYAVTDFVQAQLPMWQEVAAAYKSLPLDFTKADQPANEMTSTMIALEEGLTESLLKDTNQAYHTGINDILLGAFAKTVSKWSGQEKIVIGLEGHGREYISDEMDITNTVGWFTTLYPICLEVKASNSTSDLIKSVKEQLRVVPKNGIGFGVLKHLHPKKETRESLSSAKWDIVFNYLGQLDNVVEEENWLKPAGESPGESFTPDYPFNKLEITSAISDSKLVVNLFYNKQDFKKDTIENLLQSFMDDLTRLIEHCKEKKTPEKTPFDYGLSPEVSYDELNQFLTRLDERSPFSNNFDSIYRLSPLQEGMLFHHLFDKDSTAYNEQFIVDFPNDIDAALFEKCWHIVVQKHSILRTGIFYDELSIPVQCVMKKVEIPFALHDFSNLSDEKQAEALEDFLAKDLMDGLAFNEAPIMRVSLFKLGDRAHKLVWTCHHIILDGWSMPIIFKEILYTYGQLAKGKEVVLGKEDRYEDFIRFIGDKDPFAEEFFWRNYLKGIETPSLLPFIGNNLERNKGVGVDENILLTFDEDKVKILKQFVKDNRITVNTLIESVWAFLLSQYTDSKDVVFGITVSGRPTDLEDAEEKVGLFINTIPLRLRFNEELGFVDFLSYIQQNQLSVMDHQHTGLGEIQNWSQIQGDLFDSILVVENYPEGDISEEEEEGLSAGDLKLEEQSNYLLTINVAVSNVLNIGFGYNSSLLRDEFAQMIKAHFTTVLLQVIESVDQIANFKIKDLSALSNAERDVILGVEANKDGEWFNRPEKDLGNELPINVRFEQIAAAHPTEVAAIHGTERWDYQTLNDLSNQIGASLQAMGVAPGAFVGVYLDRSPTLIACLLGIIKSGAAYVPLDTQNPTERIEKMITSSELQTVISTTALMNQLSTTNNSKLLLVDEVDEDATAAFEAKGIHTIQDIKDIQSNSTENLVNQNDLRTWAYMLYTSGSTGEPKGAITRHDGALNHLLAEYDELELKDGFRFLQSAGIGSDISLWQMLAPLLKAGAVVIIDKYDLLNYTHVVELLSTEKIDIVEFVPSYIWGMVDHVKELKNPPAFPDLQWIMMVGEAVPVPLVNEWKTHFPHVRVLNGYGPCEASDDITQYEVKGLLDPNLQRVPIGRPLTNMHMVVLDQTGKLCPLGVAGELCVTGVGVGAGYWGMPEKTAASFIPNPFQELLGDTLYKTGDLGRWLPDGNLEFLGRIDRQVKIRGHRVELGEIETYVREEAAVQEAHIMVHKPADANQDAVIAFVVPEKQETEGETTSTGETKVLAVLENLLPDAISSSEESAKVGTSAFNLSKGLKTALEKLALVEGVSMFDLLLAAFEVCLYRYSGQENIQIGIPKTNRLRK
ncbi:MAG: amino acid adenylation domain-containing protein, partial [Saprospiraceae bacterium]